MTTVSFDTETKGLDWFDTDQQAFLTTWSDERGNDHLAHQDDPRAMAAFESDVRAADTLVAHNLGFDVHQLRATSGIDLLTYGKKLVDTALLARVTLPERRSGEGDAAGFGLDELSKTYLPAEEQKLDLSALAKQHGISLKKQGGYFWLWREEPEEFEEYAKQDTCATLELLPVLASHLTPKLAPTWQLERDLQPHLIRAEARGIKVDQAKVAPLKARYEQQRDAAYETLSFDLGDDVVANPDDSETATDHKLLAERLMACGVPLYRETPSGEIATNKFALAEFANDWPIVKALQDYRQASKFLATYIGPMDGRDTVHTSFWQLGPWTGRMSCSRPNMQNLPVRGEGSSELRAMFVPRPGHVFVVSDYDQIELRLLAHYLNSPGFKARIARGDDVFAELAAYLAPSMGWPYVDEILYRKGAPGQNYRSEAKNTTYAISYGAGGGRISDMLGLPTGPPLTADAWTVKRGYQQEGDPSHAAARRVIGEVKSWLPGYEQLAGRKGRIHGKIARDGYVSTINGRKQVVNKDKAYVGLNALIQGSAADIFKQGVINAAESTARLGAVPVLFVHDEIVTECPADAAEECMRLQDIAMRDAWDLDPCLAVSSTIAERSYADAK